MHSIKLEIEDCVFDKVIYFLQNLPKNEVKIVENIKNSDQKEMDIKAYSEHSANLIEDWKDSSEDKVWR